MSVNHSLEYIRMRMQVLKEEHERQSREIDDLQEWLDSFKKGDVNLEERDKEEQDRNKRGIDDLQMQLDSFKKGDVLLEEWDNEFMWSPSTMFLYDYDGNKVGVVKDVNDAIIEFYDF